MQETPRILKFSYLNAYYQTGMKDLIDKAVIDAAGDELDVNEIQRDYNKIDEIPFDYTRKRMSVVVVDNDETPRPAHVGYKKAPLKGCSIFLIK